MVVQVIKQGQSLPFCEMYLLERLVELSKMYYQLYNKFRYIHYTNSMYNTLGLDHTMSFHR